MHYISILKLPLHFGLLTDYHSWSIGLYYESLFLCIQMVLHCSSVRVLTKFLSNVFCSLSQQLSFTMCIYLLCDLGETVSSWSFIQHFWSLLHFFHCFGFFCIRTITQCCGNGLSFPPQGNRIWTDSWMYWVCRQTCCHTLIHRPNSVAVCFYPVHLQVEIEPIFTILCLL